MHIYIYTHTIVYCGKADVGSIGEQGLEAPLMPMAISCRKAGRERHGVWSS